MAIFTSMVTKANIYIYVCVCVSADQPLGYNLPHVRTNRAKRKDFPRRKKESKFSFLPGTEAIKAGLKGHSIAI